MLPDFLQKYSSSEIEMIQKMGYIPVNIDSYGNVLLSLSNVSVSSSLVTISMENPVYIESQIETLYDVNFTEFTVETDKVQEDLKQEAETYKNLYTTAIQEKEDVLSQLSSSLSAIDAVNRTKANDQANRQIIVGLRIKLGEGTSESEFEKYFPYLKVVDNPQDKK